MPPFIREPTASGVQTALVVRVVAPPTVHKLNVDKRPVNLRLVDLPKVNHAGLDAVWEHGGRYTVTEAKARGSIGSAYGIGRMLVREGKT